MSQSSWYISTIQSFLVHLDSATRKRGHKLTHTHTKKDKQDKCHHINSVRCAHTHKWGGDVGKEVLYAPTRIVKSFSQWPISNDPFVQWAVVSPCPNLQDFGCLCVHDHNVCMKYNGVPPSCVCSLLLNSWNVPPLSAAGICKGTIILKRRSINSRHITLWEEIFLYSLLATDYSLGCLMHWALTSLNCESVVYVYPSVINKKLNWWIRVESLLVMNITKFRMSTWIMCHWKNSLYHTALKN